MVYPLIILSFLVFDMPKTNSGLATLCLGVILVFAGFGAALLSTFSLGWKNAFGDNTGLKTTGWFKFSRNPIYVVTIIGLIGWTLIAQSALVNVVLLLWFIFYIVAPFLEEPWLEREYGEQYIAYKNKVRRFL